MAGKRVVEEDCKLAVEALEADTLGQLAEFLLMAVGRCELVDVQHK